MVNAESEDYSNPRENFGGAKKGTFKRLTALTLVSMALSAPIVGEAIVDAKKLIPTNEAFELGSMPSSEMDFEGDWEKISDSQKTKIKNTLVNLFEGEYEGGVGTDAFVIETKPFINDIVKENEEKMLAPYRIELKEKGVTDEEWVYFGANLLNAWDKSLNVGNNVSNKFQNYIERDQILDICLKKDVSKVLLRVDGNPGVLMVNCNEKVEKALKGGINWYQKNKVPDIVDKLSDNGMCIFCPLIFQDPGPLYGTFNTYGVFFINITKERLKELDDRGLEFNFERMAYVESIGIQYLKFMDSINYRYDYFTVTVTKDVLARDSADEMFKLTNIKEYKSFASHYNNQAIAAEELIGKSLDNAIDVRAHIKYMIEMDIFKPLSDEGVVGKE